MNLHHFDHFSNYAHALHRVLITTEVTDWVKTRIDLDTGIDRFIDVIAKCKETNKKVILIGNGGSAAIADHIALDLWKGSKVKAVTYSNSSAITAISNDLGYKFVYSEPIALFGKPNDVLIAISSSGASANILEAVHIAANAGMNIVTLSGFKQDNTLRLIGRLNFYVPSDVYGIVEPAHLAICHYVANNVK